MSSSPETPEPTAPHEPPPDRAAAWLVCEFVLWTSVAYLLRFFLDENALVAYLLRSSLDAKALGDGWSASSSAVALLVVASPLLAWRGRRWLGPRGASAAALAMLCFVPLLVADAACFARAPVWYGSRWKHGSAEAVGVCLSLWLAPALLARWSGAWIAAPVSAGKARAVARTAGAAMGCAALLIALSVARGRGHRAPREVFDALRDLHLVGTISDHGGPSRELQTADVGPVRVAYRCNGNCSFGIARRGAEPRPSWPEQDTKPDSQIVSLDALSLHRVTRGGLWVILENNGDDSRVVKAAFHDGSFAGTTLRLYHVSELLGVPRTTSGAAALGVVVAAVYLGLRRRALARAAALAAGHDGVVTPDGWVEFAGDPQPVRPPEPLPPGPVVLLDAGTRKAADYRGAHARGLLRARPGRKEALILEEEALASGYAALALMAAALPLATLATLAGFGFVLD